MSNDRTITRQHAAWLSLVEIYGPFLSMPVLLEAFPQGLDNPDNEPEVRRRTRLAYEEWADNQGSLHPETAIHWEWLRFVLTEVLEFPSDTILAGPKIPVTLNYRVKDSGEIVSPQLVICQPDDHKIRMLVQLYPFTQDLMKVVSAKQWKASPATYMTELLRNTGTRLGLVTNGRAWMLIDAPAGETTGYYTWDASLWAEEALALRSFRSLLGNYRLFDVPDDRTLEALLTTSTQKQQEVTNQLGEQVRRAVDMLVRTLDRLDKDSQRTLLEDISDKDLYEAALTVMMRLVFLLSAEERDMLPLGESLYDQNYAASTLLKQLQEQADQHTEAVLGLRCDAWSRLLALFRLVYGGVEYPDLRLPAYEIIHLLQSHSVMIPDDLVVATDLLQCTFTWHERRFRFQYNRQLTTTTGYTLDWQHAPSTRPDYLIERDQPLTIQHQEQLIWREPPVVLDAKYYLSGTDPSNTHGPIKKLLGDMTLLNAQHGALFFPLLPEPADDTHITRIIRQQGKQYHPGTDEPPQIRLYHLEPEMPVTLLQTRLHAILDMAANHLPERPQPVCRGIFLDRDTVNADNWKESEHSILCPKPHIGEGVIDLVNSQVDCLQNPLVCHVMGQSILVPALVRATTAEQLTTNSSEIRIRNEERLNSAEKTGDEERAEHLRQHIFANIGHSIERYVQLFGNTKAIEENFENFFFGPYWKLHKHSLAENTRRSLTSGEHIWQTYTAIDLNVEI